MKNGKRNKKILKKKWKEYIMRSRHKEVYGNEEKLDKDVGNGGEVMKEEGRKLGKLAEKVKGEDLWRQNKIQRRRDRERKKYWRRLELWQVNRDVRKKK